MKTKYFAVILVLLAAGTGFLFFWEKSGKTCDSRRSDTIVLLREPFHLQLEKTSEGFFVRIQKEGKEKTYLASFDLINFYKKVVPLCSETTYPYSPEFFEAQFCFDAVSYRICRGKRLQRGYSVALEKDGKYISDVYFIDTYPWTEIEETVRKNHDELKDDIREWVDSRILKMPEKSYLEAVFVNKDGKEYHFYKKDKEWYLGEKKLTGSFFAGFSNKLVTIRQKVDFDDFEVPEPASDPVMTVTWKIGFEEWRYSLFQTKEYTLVFYPAPDQDYVVAGYRSSLYKVPLREWNELEQNLESVLKDAFTNNQE